MKKKKQNSEKLNLPDLYYNILKECSERDIVTTSDISGKYKISENNSAFYNLKKLNFKKESGSNRIEIQPQGFTTYLAINSQKQSNKQSKKATYFATFALIVSIASFITSIIFNIIKN